LIGELVGERDQRGDEIQPETWNLALASAARSVSEAHRRPVQECALASLADAPEGVERDEEDLLGNVVRAIGRHAHAP
jgi:hypothetical protein